MISLAIPYRQIRSRRVGAAARVRKSSAIAAISAGLIAKPSSTSSAALISINAAETGRVCSG
jgi:hypothetical protein